MWIPYAEGKSGFRYMTPREVATLGRECREWPTGVANAEILTLVEEHNR